MMLVTDLMCKVNYFSAISCDYRVCQTHYYSDIVRVPWDRSLVDGTMARSEDCSIWFDISTYAICWTQKLLLLIRQLYMLDFSCYVAIDSSKIYAYCYPCFHWMVHAVHVLIVSLDFIG